jgi:hypothetical protein
MAAQETRRPQGHRPETRAGRIVKIIGITCWYDERPDWLADMIRSLAASGVHHLVAVDGAYALLRDGRPTSPADQHQAIADTCRAAGIDHTIHAPRTTWQGNEIEKRTHGFQLAEQIAGPDDWYWSMDADQVVTHCPTDLHDRLASSPHDAALVRLWERRDLKADERKAAQIPAWTDSDERSPRILFRAVPGLHLEDNHYTYIAGDGRVLWGNQHHHQVEPALDLTDLRIEHRTWLRDHDRHDQQYAYYRDRDEHGHERERCGIPGCDQWAVRSVPWDWAPLYATDPPGLAAGWLEACAAHVDQAFAESEQQLEDLGVDVEAMFKLAQATGQPMLKLARGKVPA